MTRCAKIILSILITISTLAGINVDASAQTTKTGSFTSELTGAVVEMSSNGEAYFDHGSYSSPYQTTGYVQEDIVIDLAPSLIYVSFVDGDIIPKKWNDDSFVSIPALGYEYVDILGHEDNANESWYLTKSKYGSEFHEYTYGEYYQEFANGTSVAVYIWTHPIFMQDHMEWLQSSVTIDGEPVFSDTNIGEVIDIATGNTDIEPERVYGYDSDVSDWSYLGLTSETSWEDPIFGHEVTWDGEDVYFSFHWRDTIVKYRDPSGSKLALNIENPSGMVSISTQDELDSPPEIPFTEYFADRYSSEEWLTNNNLKYPGVGAKSTDTSASAIFIAKSKYFEEYAIVRTIWQQADGSAVILDVSGRPGYIARSYDIAMRSMAINGAPVEVHWSQDELEAFFPGGEASISDTETTDDNSQESGEITRTSRSSSSSQNSEEITRTSRSSSSSQTSEQAGDSITAESSGVTINLGNSGDAVFAEESFSVSELDDYTLESVTVYYGLTVVMIDVMAGDLDLDRYMSGSELDIAATYDYMDWLGGERSDNHAWDMYSGVYKLDYREHAYLDLVYDPELDLYFGIGVYGAATDLPADIGWLQDNVTINGNGILNNADTDLIASAIDGSGSWVAEPAAMNHTTVADWEEAGLVSETEWASPFTGTIFTWDGANVVFPFTQNDALNVNDGMSLLELRTSDRRGEIRLTTGVVDQSPSDIVELYTSDEYLESQEAVGQQVTVVDVITTEETSSVILMHTTDFGDPVIKIVDVYRNADGVTIITEISAAPEEIAEVYTTFWDNVQSDGEFYPLSWTLEEIEEL